MTVNILEQRMQELGINEANDPNSICRPIKKPKPKRISLVVA